MKTKIKSIKNSNFRTSTSNQSDGRPEGTNEATRTIIGRSCHSLSQWRLEEERDGMQDHVLRSGKRIAGSGNRKGWLNISLNLCGRYFRRLTFFNSNSK